jgi:DNA-binding transcriptional regulator YiaG
MCNDTKSGYLPTRRCLDCGSLMRGRKQAYHYTECGLSSVKLADVLVFECECGARVPIITAIEALHFRIAVTLLRKQSLLAGEEIRFLRKMGGMSQADLARIMGYDKTRPSKWESGGSPISGESDRLLRSICFIKMLKQVIGLEAMEAVDRFAESEEIKSIDLESILKVIDEAHSAPEPINMPWPPSAPDGTRVGVN